MRSSSTDDPGLGAREYDALRATIAQRGSVRLVLIPVTAIAWATLALVQLTIGAEPFGSLFTLAVLAAGFEAIHALHVGVERVGRYLQVFHEETAADNSVSAKWETTAMAAGPALPGGGVDPLCTLPFCVAILLNLTLGLIPQPTPVEAVVIGVLHAALAVRILRARAVAAKQRARDLEHYRKLRGG